MVAGVGAAAIAAAAAAVACVPAAAAVFGTDDRIAVPARYRGQQAGIGLLYNSRTKTVCTAFCVADNVVATAGHCLYRTSGEAAPPIGAFAFTRTRGAGSAASASPIAGSTSQSAQQNVLSGSQKLSVRPPIDAASDWALIKLERNVCQGHVLEVRPHSADEVAKAATDKKLFQLSYHRDYADWRLAYSQPCASSRTIGGASPATLARDFAEPASLILHTCDTGGASSGSPLLIDTERGPVVVGINVGTYVQSEVVIEDGNVVRRSRAASVANTAVNVQAFSAKLALLRHADVLANGAGMRTLQDELRKRDLYEGPLDGRYSQRVREAIIAYEQMSKLPSTGLASKVMLERLNPPAPSTTRLPTHARARAKS